MQQSQQVRPISTYDNLGSGTVLPALSKPQQQRSNIIISGSESGKAREIPEQSTDSENLTTSMADDQEQELQLHRYANSNSQSHSHDGGTSHSIAAARAALNDAKSKFFGINNYESAVKVAPVVPPSEATTTTTTTAPPQMPITKPEPKYQNVPQRNNNAVNQHDKPLEFNYSSVPSPPAISEIDLPTPEKTWRYATTYEQIPLSDLDAPQPSQAVYMSTTVPQNMKGIKIAGRHTPTRNSLRHSRMIVVNHKNNDTLQEAYSTHIRNLNISRQLLILQLAIALLIVGLAIWILILAPNASILINPYLSGLSLLLASIAGLILLRRDDHRTEQRPVNNCYKVLLAESYVFSALALIFCCLALVCAAIEFAELASAGNGACGPATSSLLSYRNCTCLPHAEEEAEQVEKDKQMEAVLTASQPDETTTATGMDISYPIDENCGEFRRQWKYLLAFSMALNTLGMIATFLYITLFICCHRNRKQFYTSV